MNENNKISLFCCNCKQQAQQIVTLGYGTSFENYCPDNIIYYEDYVFARCSYCESVSIHLMSRNVTNVNEITEENMVQIFPYDLNIPYPEKYELMPDNIKKEYEMAREVGSINVLYGAAGMRKTLEALCIYINEENNHNINNGTSLHNRILKLHENGLDEPTMKTLLEFKKIGNYYSHPNDIDFDETNETMKKLFTCFNYIYDFFIVKENIFNGFLT